MKKIRPFILLITGVLTTLSFAPSLAQTVDSQLTDTVNAAFDNTRAVTSLTVYIQSSTERDGQADDGSAQQSTQSYQLVQGASGWSVMGTQTTSMNLPSGDGVATQAAVTLEFVVVDGVSYVRFINVPDMLAQQGLPQDWVELTQLAQMPAGQLLAAIPSSGTLPTGVSELLALPLDVTSVQAITELQAGTIDGQNMRVFQMTLDPAALANSDAAGLLNARMGGAGFGPGGPGGPGGQTGDGGQPPAGGPPQGEAGQPPERGQVGQPPAGVQLPDMTVSAENAQMTVTVWVGDDLLVHRLWSEVTIAPTAESGGMGAMGSTTHIAAELSGFNQPVTITAP